MLESYIKLSIAALLPVIAALILHNLDKHTPFGKLNYAVKQIIFGVIFGGLAVLGTEWGIPMTIAVANARDAAVLIAGLFFGGPAGIIAGVIGGVERWLSVYWGVSAFTRVACSVSTVLAGFYAAGLRKYMFENKRPSWPLSLAVGVVMEVFHLTMVFITNIATPTRAIEVVADCSAPMIIANGVSVMLAAMVLSLPIKKRAQRDKDGVRISQTIQRWLLLTVAVAFVVTTVFLFQFQTGISKTQADESLKNAVEVVKADIRDASDRNLLSLAKTVAKSVNADNIDEIAEKYDVAEINIVNKQGIITSSTNADFVGYDMKSGDQSAKFMGLIGNKVEYVQDYGPISYDETMYRKYAGVRVEGGFVQVGYDADHFQHDIDSEINGFTKNRKVGSSGGIIILNEKFKLVSAPKGFDTRNFDSNTASKGEFDPDTVFRIEINGVDSLCYFSSAEGYYIVSTIPVDEVYQVRDAAMYLNSFLEILIFGVLFVFVYLIIKRVVVSKIEDINHSLAKITGGDLNETINVRTNSEFASLSDDINSTVDTLKHYIDEASKRIDKELEFAKNIQASALPNNFPAFPKRKELDIHAYMDTAKEVGGDFYDFYFTRSNILNILIADVSGKGIPAAMFMMRAKSELKGLTENDLTLDNVFTKGNESLCDGNDAGMFVTAWQGRINLDNGLVQFANAGHNPPLVRHADGGFEYLKSRAGFVLAGMEGIKYRLQELQLQPGDIIFLYTDGVTEATNLNNELYGEERLQKVLNSRDFDSMDDLCTAVKQDVDAFVGDAEQFDDITMLAFKYNGDLTPQMHFDNAQISDINAVTDFVTEEMEKLDCPMKATIQMSVAIDEIYSNIVKFAYPDSTGPVTVKVNEIEEPHAVAVTFIDEGVPYNPLIKEDPDITLSAEDREIGGLGIYMVKKSMDDIQYRYENEKNVLTIIKNI